MSPFFTLPLEIRLMIYELSILHLKYPDKRPSFIIDGNSARRSKATLNSYEYKLNCEGIWSVCRQIHDEMIPLLHPKQIHLTIIDDLFFSKFSAPGSLARILEKQPWVRDHTEELYLQFATLPSEFSPPDRNVAKEYNKCLRGKCTTPHGNTQFRRPPPRLGWNVYPNQRQIETRNAWFHLLQAPAQHQPPNSLANLAAGLRTFARLKKIEIMWDNKDMSRVWADFWGDLGRLKSTGANCALIFFNEDSDLKRLEAMEKDGDYLIISQQDREGYSKIKTKVLRKVLRDGGVRHLCGDGWDPKGRDLRCDFRTTNPAASDIGPISIAIRYYSDYVETNH